jgi:pimeloyl-ACP methyl ester carboxylesterase
MNGQVAPDDPRYSLPAYLATHGVDFWALDYRTHFIPPTTRQADLAELKSWTNELFESDIDVAARFVRATTGHDRIFVSGFSRGVEFAYLYTAMHPDRVAGLVLFDGSVGRGRSGSPAANIYATDVGGRHLTWEKRATLLKLVIKNPKAPAPISKYKDASENLEHVVYDSGSFGGKGGLANPFGGFADTTVLARVLLQYDRYWPIAQDYEHSFTPALMRDLHNSNVPVLAFSSTNIARDWPGRVAGSASSTGSGDVTVKTLKGWGHLDVICGTHAETEVFAPALEWLRRHRK